jgi:hypothetical protein
MPIRINLLAEQQAAEEARRKDPVKRGIFGGVAITAVFLVWTLMAHLQLKAKTAEYVALEAEAKRVDDKAKLVRGTIVLTGDFEKRLAALERYSTNRILWASMLNAMQQSSPDAVRFKQLATHQNYNLIPTNAFVSTNIAVPWTPPTPGWKFWAGTPKPVSYLTLASNELKTLTNGGAFLTNKLPYKISMSIVGTNEQNNTVSVKTSFTLPWVSLEDADVVVSGRDYGIPPGAAIDQFEQKVRVHPYFQDWLMPGITGISYPLRAPTPTTDPMEPTGSPFVNFQMQLSYKKRPLLNE